MYYIQYIQLGSDKASTRIGGLHPEMLMSFLDPYAASCTMHHECQPVGQDKSVSNSCNYIGRESGNSAQTQLFFPAPLLLLCLFPTHPKRKLGARQTKFQDEITYILGRGCRPSVLLAIGQLEVHTYVSHPTQRIGGGASKACRGPMSWLMNALRVLARGVPRIWVASGSLFILPIGAPFWVRYRAVGKDILVASMTRR